MVYAAKSASGGPIVFKRFPIPSGNEAAFKDETECHNALRRSGGHPNVLMALKTFADYAKGEAVMMTEAGLMDMRALQKSMSFCLPAPLSMQLLGDVTSGLQHIQSHPVNPLQSPVRSD